MSAKTNSETTSPIRNAKKLCGETKRCPLPLPMLLLTRGLVEA